MWHSTASRIWNVLSTISSMKRQKLSDMFLTLWHDTTANFQKRLSVNQMCLVFHHDSQSCTCYINKELTFCSLYLKLSRRPILCKFSSTVNGVGLIITGLDSICKLDLNTWDRVILRTLPVTVPFYLVHTIVFHIHSIWNLNNIQSWMSRITMQILPKTPLRNTNKKYRW